jgi:hypothetical protein
MLTLHTRNYPLGQHHVDPDGLTRRDAIGPDDLQKLDTTDVFTGAL